MVCGLFHIKGAQDFNESDVFRDLLFGTLYSSNSQNIFLFTFFKIKKKLTSMRGRKWSQIFWPGVPTAGVLYVILRIFFTYFFFLISAILSWECEVSLKWKTGLWTHNRFIRSFSYVYSPPPPFINARWSLIALVESHVP